MESDDKPTAMGSMRRRRLVSRVAGTRDGMAKGWRCWSSPKTHQHNAGTSLVARHDTSMGAVACYWPFSVQVIFSRDVSLLSCPPEGGASLMSHGLQPRLADYACRDAPASEIPCCSAEIAKKFYVHLRNKTGVPAIAAQHFVLALALALCPDPPDHRPAGSPLAHRESGPRVELYPNFAKSAPSNQRRRPLCSDRA
jgi:hypothetical protein